MEVYKFNKSLLERLEELTNVFNHSETVITASRIKTEWKFFIELNIEPTGWQAMWNIPRVICEDLNLRYPTIVFGSVDQVIFKELKAIFTILAVQDDDVDLPEHQEVNLFDLSPTKEQKYTELDVEKTADCIDQLRFFYNNVWMPWDSDTDDDGDWVEKNLEQRIRFCYDIKCKDMKRPMAAHIKSLLAEAMYIQERQEYLELGLNDDENLEESIDNPEVTDLMRLHLRLTMIRSEIEILENPDMRKIYEVMKFGNGQGLKKPFDKDKVGKSMAYVVTKPCSLPEQMEFLEKVQKIINDPKKITQMARSLQDVLNLCNSCDDIFLPPGEHSIKFFEYLNDNGTIHGLPCIKEANEAISTEAILMSTEYDNILLVFDGIYTMKNVTLDCRNIRTGIVVKNGTVRFESCKFIGDGKSSTQYGIVSSGTSKIVLENCQIENFSIGISLSDKTDITLKSTILKNCRIGIEANDCSKIDFQSSEIIDSSKCGIYCETDLLFNSVTEQNIIIQGMTDLKDHFTRHVNWIGDCQFTNCAKGNIFIYNTKSCKFKKQFDFDGPEEDNYSSDESCDKEITDVSKKSTPEKIDSNSDEDFNSSDVIEVDDDSSVIEINCDTE